MQNSWQKMVGLWIGDNMDTSSLKGNTPNGDQDIIMHPSPNCACDTFRKRANGTIRVTMCPISNGMSYCATPKHTLGIIRRHITVLGC